MSATQSGTGSPPAPQSRRRPPSRPSRLAALLDEASKLRYEYEDWLARLPESLAETTQAEMLTAAVEQLQAVVDLLEEIELPRGFGRD